VADRQEYRFMDDVQEVLTSPAFSRLLLFLYLIPVFGMVPALWTMTYRKSDRRHRAISRLSLTLGLVWILGSVGFNTSLGLVGEDAVSAQVWMLLFNSVFSSGYFVACLGLMVRLWRKQGGDLSGFSEIAKYLP
jgi:hypothetical protein